MAQNSLHNAWSEKIAHVLEEDLDDSVHKNNLPRRRSFMNSENETFFNHSGHVNDNSFVSSLNLPDEQPFQRRSRNNRFLDDVDYETPTLNLKHTTSSETLHSRGSRGVARPSPPGSFRSTRHSTVLNTPQLRRANRDGINIIMLVGFAIGIFFGTIFSITEVYLIWFQLKMAELQMRVFDGKTVHEFYLQEGSVAKKILYGPVYGIFLILQSVIYSILISVDFLKRPAPKTLVSNIMMHYVNE